MTSLWINTIKFVDDVRRTGKLEAVAEGDGYFGALANIDFKESTRSRTNPGQRAQSSVWDEGLRWLQAAQQLLQTGDCSTRDLPAVERVLGRIV